MKIHKLVLFIFLILFLASAIDFVSFIYDKNLLVMKFYDVGQGDSLLIKTPNGKKVLIDGGPDSKIATYVLGEFFPLEECHIDIIVLTHPHLDHLSGLLDVFKLCKIETLYMENSEIKSKAFASFKQLIDEEYLENKNFKVIFPHSGDVFDLDGVNFEVKWPSTEFSSGNENYMSIVLLLKYGDFEALLTGDAEKKAYDGMVIPYQVEVLKVAHHGSVDGLHPEFLANLKPLVSVISVGKGNKYNHPSLTVVNFLAKFGTVYRTDVDGTVVIRSNGVVFSQ